jgi:beta-galactosidase
MGAFTAFDHYAVGRDLDVAAWDSYPLGFLERSPRGEAFKTRYMRVGDPDFQAFHHDLYRACGRGRWWVMEQQPGAVNWAPWNPAPAPGAVRLWTYEAFAAGAEVVSYFRWRQAPFAQEQMHEALLLPNSEPNEAYHVVAGLSRELAVLHGDARTERSAVALIFDYESAWAWNIEPQGRDFSYFELVLGFYRGLRRLGLSVDIVPPTVEAVADRQLVIAPGLFAAREELALALANSGAAVLLGPRSGSKTQDFQIPYDLPPGAFRSLIDMRVLRVESLRPGVTIAIDGADGFLEGWREFLSLGEGVEGLLRSTDGEVVLAREARNYYLAGRPDESLLDAILRRVLASTNLIALDLPRDIRLRDNGALRFVFNHGDTTIDISALVGDAPLYLGEKDLPPRGVAIVARGAV